ncbi:MAG: PQQ-binding-like beta-propeller repeat protein [Candidatus Lernaella stagnicola]|nr:PQQ-binding-like beta-propeller repeat protein [Candidatus Lernaella stagnicola]
MPHERRRRPLAGRLLFAVFTALIALLFWRLSVTGEGVASHQARAGEITDIAYLGEQNAVARLRFGEVLISGPGAIKSVAVDRPLQLVPDGKGGLFVVGLLGREVHQLDPDGTVRTVAQFPSSVFVTGVLADRDTIWVAGYFRSRYESRPKKHVYLPEHSQYLWFALSFEDGLPDGRVNVPESPRIRGVTRWHEESGGRWTLLADETRLYIVNDQAETLTAVDKQTGGIVWQQEIDPRPTGALRWRDRILIPSAQAGRVCAHAVDDGRILWQAEIGAGLTDIAYFGERVFVTDWRRSRLVTLGPENGATETDIHISGSPRYLAVRDGELAVWLSAAGQVVTLNAAGSETGRVSLFGGDAK